jgi:hypothetical protein
MEYSRPGIEAFVSKIVGLKGEDLDWASGLGKKYGQNEELDGRGDAARHLALGWLAANAENPETAKRAIQAREYLDTDYIRELLGGQFFGKEMDLQNNNLGMQIPAKTKEEAEAMIGRIIDSGDATFMTPQESRDMRGYAEGGEVSEMDPAFLEALKQQRLREEAFNNEFGIEVAAQSNYAADIDPTISRYYGFEGLPGDRELNIKGFYIPEQRDFKAGDFLDDRKGFIKGIGRIDIPQEVGAITTVHSGANPVVLAHEYRHKQFPDASEYENTLADASTALNEDQWNYAVDRFRRNYLQDTGNITNSEAQDILIRKLQLFGGRIHDALFGAEWDRGARSTNTGIKEDRDEYIKSRRNDSFWKKRADDLEALKEYNEELPDQNKDRIEEAAVRNYAEGGGITALAPMARNMYNQKGDNIRQGVGAFTQHISRRA